MTTPLDARLRVAAAYVRQGAHFADIGTDHAYLPVFLCQTGIIDTAVAADVAPGPLSRAAAHIAAAGLSDRIETCLADGLTGLDNRHLTDIAICGMGGEMIASILAAAPFVQTPDIRLILQPMTRAAHLRRYLADAGFAVDGERLCRAKGRLYACLCAHYTGVPYHLTPVEAELGISNLSSSPRDSLFPAYLDAHLSSVRRRYSGLLAGGLPAEAEARLISEMEALR